MNMQQFSFAVLQGKGINLNFEFMCSFVVEIYDNFSGIIQKPTKHWLQFTSVKITYMYVQ